jgi:RsiW-degrading membrane proteinase PrsW (M82 family)
MPILNMLPGFLVAFSFYGFYRRLFPVPPGLHLSLVAFFYSLAAVGLAIFLEIFLENFFPTESDFTQAFLLSALPEEIAKFVFIYFYFRASKITHDLAEGIFYGILFGLSFGLLENLLYSLKLGFWPMMVRSTTALPLHMITSGILGAFILSYFNENPRNNPEWKLAKGLVYTYLIHGIYNYSVFDSGHILYFMPMVLICGFILLEYEIMVSQNTLPAEVMDLIHLHWDDYRTIFRFKQYLTWMDVDQEKFTLKQFSIIRKPEPIYIYTSLLFLSIGLLSFSFFLIFPEKIPRYFLGISFPEYFSIFIYYPFFISLVLSGAGTLNPDYFRSRILRIPLFVSLAIKSPNYSEMTVAFSISRTGFYVELLNPTRFPKFVNLEFWIAGRTIPNVTGELYWIDSKEESENSGALIKFVGFPFRLFIYWKYAVIRQRIKNIFSR